MPSRRLCALYAARYEDKPARHRAESAIEQRVGRRAARWCAAAICTRCRWKAETCARARQKQVFDTRYAMQRVRRPFIFFVTAHVGFSSSFRRCCRPRARQSPQNAQQRQVERLYSACCSRRAIRRQRVTASCSPRRCAFAMRACGGKVCMQTKIAGRT